MIEAITYADMLEHIRNNDLVEDTVGILLTRPDLQTGEEIMGSLNYYHHLTGHNINFYLPGYGAYWNNAEYPDMRFAAKINGVSWSFSDKAFVMFVDAIENVSRWKYSGESELLLIPYHDKNLDYSNVAVFHLDAKTIGNRESLLRPRQLYFVDILSGLEGSNQADAFVRVHYTQAKRVIQGSCAVIIYGAIGKINPILRERETLRCQQYLILSVFSVQQ